MESKTIDQNSAHHGSIKQKSLDSRIKEPLENPQVIKTPVVRNGKQSSLGYQPDIWKAWK